MSTQELQEGTESGAQASPGSTTPLRRRGDATPLHGARQPPLPAPAQGQDLLSVLLLSLVQEPAMLGVQMGRVRSEHLGLWPGESRTSQRWPQRASRWLGEGWHLPQVLQVGSRARWVLRLRGRWSGGSPKEGTKPTGRRHHLPDSALEQLRIDGGKRAPDQARDPGKLAGGHSAGLAEQRGCSESVGGEIWGQRERPSQGGCVWDGQKEPCRASSRSHAEKCRTLPMMGARKAKEGSKGGFTWAPPSSCALCRWVRTGETLWGNGWPKREEFWGKRREEAPRSQPWHSRWRAEGEWAMAQDEAPGRVLWADWEPGQAPRSRADPGRRGRWAELWN